MDASWGKLYDIVFTQTGAVGVILLAVIAFLVKLLYDERKEKREDRKEVLELAKTFAETLKQVEIGLKLLMERLRGKKD